MVIVMGLYLSFGILGYLFFGDDTQSVITSNLGSGHLATSVKVALCISLFFSFAIQMFPVSRMCDRFLAKRLGILADSDPSSSRPSEASSPTSSSRYNGEGVETDVTPIVRARRDSVLMDDVPPNLYRKYYTQGVFCRIGLVRK